MLTNAVLLSELRAYPLPGDMALVSPSNDLRNNILLGATYIFTTSFMHSDRLIVKSATAAEINVFRLALGMRCSVKEVTEGWNVGGVF